MSDESTPQPPKPHEPTSLDRLADLTRRVVAVPKAELPKPKKKAKGS